MLKPATFWALGMDFSITSESTSSRKSLPGQAHLQGSLLLALL